MSDASTATPSDQLESESPAALARLLSDSAQERHRAAKETDEVLLPEDLLPGTREERMSLRDGLRKTGATTFVVLAVIVALDNLQSQGLSVLAPCSVRQLPGQSGSRLAEAEHAVPEVLDPEVPRRVHRRSA